MVSTIRLSDGAEMTAVFPRQRIREIDARSFRGSDCRRAWNFSRFPDSKAFLTDACIEVALQNIGNRQASVLAESVPRRRINGKEQIVYPGLVGWSANTPLPGLDQAVLVDCDLSARAFGLCVSLEADMLSPSTNMISMNYSFQAGKRRWELIIYDLYPGQLIPRMKGNVTRFGVAFFKDCHPGV